MDAFQETLVDELGNKTAFTIPLLGGIPVSESVVVSWIVMAVLVILSLVLTRRLSVRNPGKVQVALESGVQFFNGFLKGNLGSHWRPFVPWLGTVALYIALSNIIGIFGLTPPTKDINVTAALALMSMLLIYGAQFRYNGPLGGLKKFAEPMPLLIPINLIVHHLTGLPTLSAILPVLGAVLLILISMALTFIAGLIPSGMAAKKDPVVALRTE